MTAKEYLNKTADKRLKEFFKLLSFPSVSAKSEHKKDIKACAEWLRDHLKAIGFKARLCPTGGHPVVYAEYTADPKAPTALYYGHYDVQPAEPFELWKSEPFKAEVRDGYIYARGADDDKGQTFANIKGLEAVIKATGTLPINVKFLIEGEEEAASENLPAFIARNKKMLKADVVVISDTAQFSKSLPAVTYGLRGIAATELFVYGPKHDLHSGTYGGTISNPANVLCQIVGQLHDKNGKVAVPGFYAKAKPLAAWERREWKKLPFTQTSHLKVTGSPAVAGEKGYSTLERAWSRPTLDVNGIKSGYQGEGSKTIIPSFASCKITMRLVPNMDPKDTFQKVDRFIKKIAPKSVKTKYVFYGGAAGSVVPNDGPWLEAAARAIEKGFGKRPIFMKEGGSIPVVGDFKRILGIDSLLIGYGQKDDYIHSPNERFRLKDFERGCKTAAALPFELARVK